jgi:hypothetical protein
MNRVHDFSQWQMFEAAKTKPSQEIVDSMNQSEVGQGVIAVGAKVKSQGPERVTLSGLNSTTVIETPDHPDNPLDSWLVYYTGAGKNYGHAWFKTLPEVWKYIWERNLELTLPIPVGKKRNDIPEVIRGIGIKPEDKLSWQEIRARFIEDLSGQDLDPDDLMASPELREFDAPSGSAFSFDPDRTTPLLSMKRFPGGIIAQMDWGRYWLADIIYSILKKYISGPILDSDLPKRVIPRIAPENSHGRNTGMSPEKILLTTDMESSITDLKRAAKTKYVIRAKKEDIPALFRKHIEDKLFGSFEATHGFDWKKSMVNELVDEFASYVVKHIRTEPEILKKLNPKSIENFLKKEFDPTKEASMLQLLTPPDKRISGFKVSDEGRKSLVDLLMKLMRNETSRNETLEFLESLGDSHLKDISPDLLKEYKIMVRNRDMFI